MSQQRILLIRIFIGIAFAIFVSPPVLLADSGTHWLIVDATPEARAYEQVNSLIELLTTRGKVPSAQIHRVEGDTATPEEIHATLQEIGRQTEVQDTLVFLYHGMVTKPRGMNAMHLLTQGDEQGIQDATLNDWFRERKRKDTIVIVDGYTEDTNLNAYYANRETLGTAALNSIQPAANTDTTLLFQQLYDALATGTTDTNDNRQLSIIECYELLRDNPGFVDGILAPTGDVEMALLKLSPALKITTFPEDANIFINDVEMGSTPKLITENLQQGTSTVTVKKAGYIIPPPKTAELQLELGESVHLGWALEPIAVQGVVTGVSDVSPAGAVIWIDGTAHQQTVEADGIYRFDEWKDSGLLSLGDTYTLYVKQGNLNYGSATFTFDGYTDIAQSLQLVKRTWFEVSQIEFDRHNHQGAVTAFQNGIELTSDFPQMSPDLTVLLLSSFADAVEKQDVQDVTYLVVTAKLADQHGQPELAKKYWEEVKIKAESGSSAAKLASQRLWDLNRGRYLLNIGLIVLLAVLLASGVWTFIRFRKSKRTVPGDAQ